MLTNIFEIEHIIHSFKTALACVIGIIVIKLANFQSGQWIMVSIIIVMCAQINVGGLVQKSFLRLIGTLAGCIIAIAALLLFGDTETVIIFTIAIASFFFSYIATSQESLMNLGTLGAATTAIVMITKNPTPELATNRFFEISIGILIAALVSQIVLPIHARTHLLRAQARTLKLLRDFYLQSMETFLKPLPLPLTQPASAENKSENETLHLERFIETDEDIVKTITKQRQLSKEAAREPLGVFFDRQHFTETLICEKEILRSIDFMHYALFHLKTCSKLNLDKSDAIKYLNDTIPSAFNSLVQVMESEDISKLKLVLPSMTTLKTMLPSTIIELTQDEAIYLDGFLFSTEIFINCLKKLATLFNLPISESS